MKLYQGLCRGTAIIGLGLLLAAMGGGTVQAAEAAAAAQPAAQPSPTEAWIKNVKNPVTWMTWGGDLRLRNEYLNNAASLDQSLPFHEQDYFRFRGRVWASMRPIADLALNVRVTAEPREYMKPKSATLNGMDWTEGIIDNLNVSWSNAFTAPLTITVGRQDIMLGSEPMNWWLVADGTPLDGSRTFYFDAARMTLDLKDYQTTIEGIGIYQTAMNNEWLPVFNNLEKAVTDQDEAGGILYISNKSLKNTEVNGYFMYKNDRRTDVPTGINGETYTTGARIAGDPAEHWRYSAEGAYQWGHHHIQSVSAFGANARLSYLFKDHFSNKLKFDIEYASGDKPGTAKYEGFDMLWGRYPRWSDLYIYSYAKEARVADNSNLIRFGPGWSIAPCSKSEFIANYYALFADQSTPTSASNANLPQFSQNGNFRGHMLQAILKYKFNARITGHLWSEFVFPGDFYAHQEMMTFLRAELMVTF